MKENYQTDMTPEKNNTGGSRACAPENEQEQVSVSKETLPGGAELTKVVHPPRRLKTPGEIKAAYEAGEIDVDQLVANVNAGLRAMKPIVTTQTEGAGKDRRTSQQVTYVPDFDTRLRWQDHLTNTVEGMPIKRQEIVSRKVTTDEDLITQAKRSPAFARSIKGMLEKITEIADAHHSKKGGAHSAPSIGHH